MKFFAVEDADLSKQLHADIEDKVVHKYQQVKDSTWPQIQHLDQFELLPQPLVEEIINVHNIYDVLPWVNPQCIKLDVGVEMNTQWLNLLQNLMIQSWNHRPRCTRVNTNFAHLISGQGIQKLISSALPLAQYTVDACSMTAKISLPGNEYTVDLTSRSTLDIAIDQIDLSENWFLICCPELQHQDHTLTLATTDPNEHWGLPDIFHLHGNLHSLQITTDLYTGQITMQH
jgi:hypothetical protein